MIDRPGDDSSQIAAAITPTQLSDLTRQIGTTLDLKGEFSRLR